MLAVYVLSILLFLILFVLITSIEFTMDAEARHREEENLLKGSFAVKWLFLSRKISIERPEKKESAKPEMGKKSERKEGDIEIEKGKGIEREKEREVEGEQEARIKREQELRIEREQEARIEREQELRIEREQEARIEREQELRIEREKKEEIEKKKIKGIEKEKVEKIEKEKLKGKEKKVEKKKVEKIETEIEESKESKKFWKKEYSYILRAFRCLREPLFRLFSDTLNALKIKHLDADFTFGLPDPADTGMLCGFFHSLLGALHGRCRQCSVYINPVFMDPVLDFRGNTKISIKIYSIIFSFFKFILNRKTLCFTYSIIKEWLQGKLKANSQAL